MEMGDSEFMFELLNTEGWINNIGNRNINTLADATSYIEKINSNPNYLYLVFRLKETKHPLGLVTLIKRDYLEDCDIGFALLPQFQNKGFAFEASSKFMEVIVKDGQINKVVAITLPDNLNSIKLIEKLGLNYEKTITENGVKLSVYKKILR
jgi:RimJ/RimL family protein N-acetyltransferase